MRAEFAGQLAITLLVRQRHGGDADRVTRLVYVEYPNALDAVGAIVLGRLVGDDEEIAIRELQRRVRRRAERRMPNAMRKESRLGRIGDVEHGEPAVEPGAVGGGAGDDGVVQGIAAALRPLRRLT